LANSHVNFGLSREVSITSYRGDWFSEECASEQVLASTTAAEQSCTAGFSRAANTDNLKSKFNSASLGRGILIDGRRWFSRAEYASAVMMERFVAGFRTVRGLTYQVPVASNEHGTIIPVDFVLRSVDDCPVILEFHVPRDWRMDNRVGDFRSLDEYKSNRATARALRRAGRPDEVRRFKKQTWEELLNNYREKLRNRIDRNEEYRGVEIIVVTSAHEFYRSVIRRFGTEFPSEGRLVAAFNSLARIKRCEDWARGNSRQAA